MTATPSTITPPSAAPSRLSDDVRPTGRDRDPSGGFDALLHDARRSSELRPHHPEAVHHHRVHTAHVAAASPPGTPVSQAPAPTDDDTPVAGPTDVAAATAAEVPAVVVMAPAPLVAVSNSATATSTDTAALAAAGAVTHVTAIATEISTSEPALGAVAQPAAPAPAALEGVGDHTGAVAQLAAGSAPAPTLPPDAPVAPALGNEAAAPASAAPTEAATPTVAEHVAPSTGAPARDKATTPEVEVVAGALRTTVAHTAGTATPRAVPVTDAPPTAATRPGSALRDRGAAPAVAALPTTAATPVVVASTETAPKDAEAGVDAPARAAAPAVAAAPTAVVARPTAAVTAHVDEVVVAREAPMPAEQIVDAVLPLRQRADGDYKMRLELRPAELGRVELHVELHDGVLSVHMNADQPAARDLLQRELHRLRELLSHEGVRAGDLTVTDQRLADRHTGDANRRGRSDATLVRDAAAPFEKAASREAPRASTNPRTVAAGRVDVHA